MNSGSGGRIAIDIVCPDCSRPFTVAVLRNDDTSMHCVKVLCENGCGWKWVFRLNGPFSLTDEQLAGMIEFAGGFKPCQKNCRP